MFNFFITRFGLKKPQLCSLGAHGTVICDGQTIMLNMLPKNNNNIAPFYLNRISQERSTTF